MRKQDNIISLPRDKMSLQKLRQLALEDKTETKYNSISFLCYDG